MFRKTHLQLTLFYSGLFLILFWAFSFGLYTWMNNYFGEGYISQVRQRQGPESDPTDRNTKIVTIAGDVAIDQLRTVLIFLNGALLAVIPVTSWFLAKRTLSPVQKAHEQQKQFVSDASHEMRTPLSIISGEIEVALKKYRSKEEYQKILVSTKEETDRLSKLVENLLFLASSDNNSRSVKIEEVDITDIVSSVAGSLQSTSRSKNITISLDTDKVLSPIVYGNPIMLHQLFYNIIQNAVSYTPRNGRIAIAITERDNAIAIAIKDTGIGIDKKDQEKILDRFYRADSSRSEHGYGLGLAIVKVILDIHKGYLQILSVPRKGSTFTVFLPKK